MKKILFGLISTLFLTVGCSSTVSNVVNHNTPLQKLFLADDYENIHNYAVGVNELSKPNFISVIYNSTRDVKIRLNELDKNGNVVSYCSINPSNAESAKITNFKINTDYTYTVEQYIAGILDTSFTSQKFTVEGSIRNIDVGGVTNVRDLGGKKTEDGKMIKQGLLYRSGEWNYSSYTRPRINEDGEYTITDQLKIKTELDLRNFDTGETGGITESVVEGVDYKNISMSGDDLKTDINKTAIKKIFEYLSVPEHYPNMFHCAIGTDRTGLVAFCLNAILGLSEADIYKDYLFSNFANIGSKRNPNAIYLDIARVGGDTSKSLKDRTINYLVNEIGVNQEHIDAVRYIMLED